MGDVRHVVAADIAELAAVLARAFADDPLMGWIYPNATTRDASATAWWDLSLRLGLSKGHTYAVGGSLGAAIWAPPDVAMFDDAGAVALYSLLADQLGDAVSPTMEGLLQVSAAHPHDQPHFYLFGIGVLPEARGRGLASSMLTEVLSRCDAQGLPAYLESSNPVNVPLYERHGFSVIEEVQLPDGPVVRPMWRAPRS